MRVKVKFRDVSFDEAMCCRVDVENVQSARWDIARGTDVFIEVPALPDKNVSFSTCDGPWYMSDWITPKGSRAVLCPHILEIGD